MKEERTLLFDNPVWITVWSKEQNKRVTYGPCEAVGIELNCDDLDIDCIVVKGAPHTHHHPENVYATKEEADYNTERQNSRDIRRNALSERLKQKGTSRGITLKVAHNQGESNYKKISDGNTAKQDDAEQGY